MPNSVEMPGQQALMDLPASTTQAPETATESSYADWAADAAVYILRRASQPGPFTFFDALIEAPADVKNPASPKWPGRLAVALHAEGHIEYARDMHGTERWDMSHRPKSSHSGVRVWVGTAGQAAAA